MKTNVKNSIIGLLAGLVVALINIVFVSIQGIRFELVIWELLLWPTAGWIAANLEIPKNIFLKSILVSMLIASTSLVFMFSTSVENGAFNSIWILVSAVLLGLGLRIGSRRKANQ